MGTTDADRGMQPWGCRPWDADPHPSFPIDPCRSQPTGQGKAALGELAVSRGSLSFIWEPGSLPVHPTKRNTRWVCLCGGMLGAGWLRSGAGCWVGDPGQSPHRGAQGRARLLTSELALPGTPCL